MSPLPDDIGALCLPGLGCRLSVLICCRSGNVNFAGRPPAYLGANESNPSTLKLWITSLARV